MQAAAHRVFAVHDSSQVSELRQAALSQAQALGFDEVTAAQAELVASELGARLVRHAQHGRLLLAAVEGDDGEPLVELMSLDDGPDNSGVRDKGLDEVRRLSALFELHTSVPQGTLIVARIGALPSPSPSGPPPTVLDATRRLQCGAVMQCAAGETVCGDAWALERDDDRCALLVADGIGHGLHAADAAQAAVNVFREDPWALPSRVIERVQQALGSPRGAALCVVQAELAQRRLLHAAAGRIGARLLSGVDDRSLPRRLQDHPLDWPPHALLVLHSDGIASGWRLGEERTLLEHHPALLAAWLLRRHLRGRDDATAVVLKLQGH